MINILLHNFTNLLNDANVFLSHIILLPDGKHAKREGCGKIGNVVSRREEVPILGLIHVMNEGDDHKGGEHQA